MGGQLRLKLERATDFSRDRLIISDSNREAARMLETWPDARGGALALIGPQGVGKSHFAAAWAERTGAVILNAEALDQYPLEDARRLMLLDDADLAPHGEGFFHLLNKAATPGNALLLTGRLAPREWPVEVQDLRSRLNALPVVELGPPDDRILHGVLLKLFDERLIRPPADLIAYLSRRMERSVPAAQAIVAALDEAASADNQPISRALARRLLKDEDHDDD